MEIEKFYNQAPLVNWNRDYFLLKDKNEIPLVCEFGGKREVHLLKSNNKLDEITFDNFKAGLDNLREIIKGKNFVLEETQILLSYSFDVWDGLSNWKYAHSPFLVMLLSYQNQLCSLEFKATSPQIYTCRASMDETFLEKNFKNFLGPNISEKIK